MNGAISGLAASIDLVLGFNIECCAGTGALLAGAGLIKVVPGGPWWCLQPPAAEPDTEHGANAA